MSLPTIMHATLAYLAMAGQNIPGASHVEVTLRAHVPERCSVSEVETVSAARVSVALTCNLDGFKVELRNAAGPVETKLHSVQGPVLTTSEATGGVTVVPERPSDFVFAFDLTSAPSNVVSVQVSSV